MNVYGSSFSISSRHVSREIVVDTHVDPGPPGLIFRVPAYDDHFSINVVKIQ